MKAALSLFCLLIAVPSWANPLSPQEESAFEAKIQGLAATYFPAIVQEKNPPKHLLLGFLLDKSGRVVRHSVSVNAPPPVPVWSELKRMFPEYSREQLMKNSAGCVFKEGTQTSQYCVIFAELGE